MAVASTTQESTAGQVGESVTLAAADATRTDIRLVNLSLHPVKLYTSGQSGADYMEILEGFGQNCRLHFAGAPAQEAIVGVCEHGPLKVQVTTWAP